MISVLKNSYMLMSYCDVTNPKLGQMHKHFQSKVWMGIHLLYPLYKFLKTWSNAMGDVNMEWRRYSTALFVYNILPTSHLPNVDLSGFSHVRFTIIEQQIMPQIAKFTKSFWTHGNCYFSFLYYINMAVKGSLVFLKTI